MFERKELEKEKKSLQSIKEQMGININKEYKENNYENQLANLTTMFRMSNDLSVKEDIANQIVALRGELPLDIRMELDSFKSSMRK